MGEEYARILREKKRRGIPRTAEQELEEEAERIQRYIERYGKEPSC